MGVTMLLKILCIIFYASKCFSSGKTKFLIVKTRNYSNETKEQEHGVNEGGEDYIYGPQPGIRKNIFGGKAYNPDNRFVLIEETHLQRNKLLYTIPYLKQMFKISFDLFLNPSEKYWWQSALHLTQGWDNSRLPALFLGSRNKLLVVMSPSGTSFYSTTVLTEAHKRKWVYVEMEQRGVKNFGKGKGGQHEFVVRINKAVVFSKKYDRPKGCCHYNWNIQEPSDLRNVSVYGGDPWYPSADAKIRNLIISPQSNRPLKTGEPVNGYSKIKFFRGRKNAVLAYMAREYKISFLLYLTSPPGHEWESVLHVTNQGNYPRIPAIFIGKGNLLYIVMQDMVFIDKTLLKTNKYLNIELSQKWVDGKYMFEVRFEDHPKYYRPKFVPKRVFYEENKNARVFWDIDIYFGDPWYPAAQGWLTEWKYEILH